MDAAQRRTERNHLQMRIFLEEQAALQSGMDRTHLGLHTEKFLIAGNRDFQQFGLGIGRPAGIPLRMRHLGTRQSEHRFDHLRRIDLGTLHRGALRSGHDDPIVPFEFHRSEVGRCLDKSRHGQRHLDHSVGESYERVKQVALGRRIDHRCGRHLFDSDLEIRFPELGFGCKFPGKLLVESLEAGFRTARHGENRIRLARNGIAQVAAVETAQAQSETLGAVPQQPCDQFVGIHTTLIDVVAGVSARKVGYPNPEKGVGFRCGLRLITERSQRINAAGAADENFAFVLGIEVHQVTARKHSFTQSESTGKTGFFVHREQRLQRTVFQCRIEQRGKGCRHTDTVVGTERRTFGLHPAIDDLRADGILVEVERRVRIFLAHHIHMGLKNDAGTVLIPFRTGHAHHDITRLVGLIVDVVFFCEIHEELPDLFLFLGGTRHPRNGIEQLPDELRF